MLTIHSATVADALMLQALAHSIWNQVYPSIISQDQIDFMLAKMYDPAQIAAEMGGGVAWEWVEDEGVAIGFLATLFENNTTIKISKIYVEPAHHGKGVGQFILQHIDAKAKSAGVGRIYLYVNRSNERAVKAYLRGGYEIIETLDQTFGSFVLNDFKMMKTF